MSLTATREAAKNVTKEQHDDAVHRLDVYKTFMINEVLKVGEKESMLILPITSQAVDYRDEPAEYVARLAFRLSAP